MGVFEEVVINAKTAAATVGKKAERLVDISKLRLNSAEIESEITKKYEALGRFVYDSINEKINMLRKKVPCPVCGCQNDENALFCSHCGVKLKYNEQGENAQETPAGDEGVSDNI